MSNVLKELQTAVMFTKAAYEATKDMTDLNEKLYLEAADKLAEHLKVEVSDHKEPDVPTFEEWKKHYTSLPLEQRTEALWAAHYRLKLVNINELARPAGK